MLEAAGVAPLLIAATIAVITATTVFIVIAGSCGGPAAPKTEIERTVVDTARGVSYVVPEGWKASDAEFRSPAGSLLTLRVYDLAEADRKFVGGLPESLLPQLTEWAKYYYVVDGDPVRSETTVAGSPATEWNYPIRIRPGSPPTKVTYWVVRHETRLFIIRAAYPHTGLAVDEPVMRRAVDSWAFL